MGPSIKFVLAIVDAFSNKKMGVNFFHRKKPNREVGGVWGSQTEGGLAKYHTFPDFFPATFPTKRDLFETLLMGQFVINSSSSTEINFKLY